MVERSRRFSDATIATCRTALREGIACNLAGGTHHAHADHGSGHCVFNDAAVATRVLQRDLPELRVAIVDLDVNQGEGTASILGRIADVFTLSLHGEASFPARKASSHLGVALADGAGDADYLAALSGALCTLFSLLTPDLIIYLAEPTRTKAIALGAWR